ncbi:MAG TPA: arylsulfatase [Planctomycetes bacterium]|nr:arylsulfatase [Planctomycetota bacterium]
MSRPNILLLYADQHRRDWLGCYGADWMHSPNIDALASEGVAYDRSYTHVPVCVAARYGLVTGQRCKVTGYYGNEARPMDAAIPVLPQMLSDAGYVAQAVGKMHFQPPRRHHGFDRLLLMEETPETREEDDYLLYLKSVGLGNIRHAHGVRHLLYHQPQRSIVPEEHMGTRWVADRSIEFLRAHRKRPFFLWSSWIMPHPPFNAAPRWAEYYLDKEMPAPVCSPDEALSEHVRELGYIGDVDFDDRERMRRVRQLYAAQISFVDEQAGRVLDELERLGLAENTLVVYSSDHGELLGDHYGWQKGNAYEGAIAVPMVARFPGRLRGGSRRSEFVDALDIFPTFLEAAGLPLPEGREYPGGSLLALDAGRDTRDRSHHYCEYASGWWGRFVAVINERYKLAYYARGGCEEMYDLKNDPGELVNLCLKGMDVDAQKAYGALRKRLIDFERAWGPDGLVDGKLPFHPSDGLSLRRNSQLPEWPHNVADDAERAAINSVEEEVLAVTKDEPAVKLSKLDIDFWVSRGGPGEFAERLKKGDFSG